MKKTIITLTSIMFLIGCNSDSKLSVSHLTNRDESINNKADIPKIDRELDSLKIDML